MLLILFIDVSMMLVQGRSLRTRPAPARAKNPVNSGKNPPKAAWRRVRTGLGPLTYHSAAQKAQGNAEGRIVEQP